MKKTEILLKFKTTENALLKIFRTMRINLRALEHGVLTAINGVIAIGVD